MSAQRLAADWVVQDIADRAGVPFGAQVTKVDEVLFETVDLTGFGVEVWTRFEYATLTGTEVAHLPGRLDSLISNQVREQTSIEIGTELAAP